MGDKGSGTPLKHLPAGDQPRHFRPRLGEVNAIDGRVWNIAEKGCGVSTAMGSEAG
jgi:hypothetical protein